MNRQKIDNTAFDLGQKAIERIETASDHEKLRRHKVNEAEIAGLEVRLAFLRERLGKLQKLAELAPLSNLSVLRKKLWTARLVSFLFAACGVFFAHLALAPFGLGWETWAFSVGLGLVGFLATDRFLTTFESQRLMRILSALAFVTSLAGLLILAFLRGEVVALYVQQALSTSGNVLVTSLPDPAQIFYAKTIQWLQLFMAFLAIGMELTAGLTLNESRKLDPSAHETGEKARKQLEEVENEVINVQQRITYLHNEPEIYEQEFLRDLRTGVLDRLNRNGIVKVLVLAAFLLTFGFSAHAQGKSALNIVIGIDLSKSVATSGYDGQSEFAKNVQAAEDLIFGLPPASRITVLALTDQSFSRAYILTRGELPDAKRPLPFLDPVLQAKRHLAAEIRRLQSLKPEYEQTDLLGALVLAADLFKQTQGRKALVLLSDMRQATPEINFEKSREINAAAAIKNVARLQLLADLRDVEVYALGVDGAGKPVSYWESLRRFWSEYFNRAGAALKAYSPNRISIQFETGARP